MINQVKLWSASDLLRHLLLAENGIPRNPLFNNSSLEARIISKLPNLDNEKYHLKIYQWKFQLHILKKVQRQAILELGHLNFALSESQLFLGSSLTVRQRLAIVEVKMGAGKCYLAKAICGFIGRKEPISQRRGYQGVIVSGRAERSDYVTKS